MSPLQQMADMVAMSEIEHGLDEGKGLQVVLAEMVARYTALLADTLRRQGMPAPASAMIPATFHAFQMQVGSLICVIDGKEEINEHDPLIVEMQEKLQPVAEMVNGLLERFNSRN